MKKVIGWTEDINQCDCCGKSDLKGTFCVLVDEQEVYFGSVCVTKKHGVPAEETKKAMKAFDEKNRAERERLMVVKQSRGKFEDKALWMEYLHKVSRINQISWQQKMIAHYTAEIEKIRSKEYMGTSDRMMIEEFKGMIKQATEWMNEGLELQKTFVP